MKKYLCLLAVGTFVTVFYSCQRLDSPEPEGGGEAYLDLPETVYQYQGTVSNMYFDKLNHQATLGRVLFYERQLSINNSVSCGSCHKQALAFADNVAGSVGFENRITGRNTPAIQNLSFSGFQIGGTDQNGARFFDGNARLFWDGRENNIGRMVTGPITNHIEMGLADKNTMVEKIKALPYYKELFMNAFGSEEVNAERISSCVAVFMLSIKSQKTRFDQDSNGRKDLFSAMEREGAFLFEQKYNCTNCHNENLNGYNSSIVNFKNIGLDAPYTDKGLGTISRNSANDGSFKVPNLRNIALTAPYMHDGRFKNLDEVLDHYSHGIKGDANLDTLLKNPMTGTPMRMNISKHEKEAIIAFLGTLTDFDMITNPAFSDPFKTR